MSQPPVNDATVSNAAEGVFVGVEPATRIQSGSPSVPEEAPVAYAVPTEKYFTEADIEKVRQEEKSKLYGQLQQAKDEATRLRQENEERLRAESEEAEQARLAQEKEAEEEMSLRDLLAKKEQEMQAQIEQERLAREQAFALLEKEREFSALKDYRDARLAEHGADIIPELLDMVTGNTPDEINASIAGLVDRSSRILEGAQQAIQSQRQQMQGTRATAPLTELEINSAHQELSVEDIANMPMNEWAKRRGSLLGQSGSGTGRGMFG
jgi:hypothetical protein